MRKLIFAGDLAIYCGYVNSTVVPGVTLGEKGCMALASGGERQEFCPASCSA
jgi:hypothetical protein